MYTGEGSCTQCNRSLHHNHSRKGKSIDEAILKRLIVSYMRRNCKKYAVDNAINKIKTVGRRRAKPNIYGKYTIRGIVEQCISGINRLNTSTMSYRIVIVRGHNKFDRQFSTLKEAQAFKHKILRDIK